MKSKVLRNRKFLADLFAGPFRGHGIIMDHEPIPSGMPADVASSDRPVTDWLDFHLRNYEAQVRVLEATSHDGVPYVKIHTGTQLFAEAFGCPVHVYEDGWLAARPLVETPAEADALVQPTLDARPLQRVFELAALLRERVGPDVPISVPDIQSPFDIAALIWRKEAMFLAMVDAPDAVKGLVEKCHALLEEFLRTFIREVGEVNLCHCPTAWAPPELGCWLSEDEAGSMSTEMFEEFCLPSLTRLSAAFGGLFIHCCANADHQYSSFLKIPNLRGLNRVFQAPGPRPAIEAFAGRAVLIQAWMTEQQVNEMLDMALPESRFIFNMPPVPLDEAKALYERMRERCPREE
ncbi:MAG: hypothetical protein N2512_12450 [Armatimonadetes bacterium]|nr:hypothetical protein [Armatimonadota bacterium]